MRTLHTIRKEDYFAALAQKQISQENRILYAGTTWIGLLMSETEAAAYTFPIEKYNSEQYTNKQVGA